MNVCETVHYINEVIYTSVSLISKYASNMIFSSYCVQVRSEF
jgi:hypothetical protein